jgi:hypothetical protein
MISTNYRRRNMIESSMRCKKMTEITTKKFQKLNKRKAIKLMQFGGEKVKIEVKFNCSMILKKARFLLRILKKRRQKI